MEEAPHGLAQRERVPPTPARLPACDLSASVPEMLTSLVDSWPLWLLRKWPLPTACVPPGWQGETRVPRGQVVNVRSFSQTSLSEPDVATPSPWEGRRADSSPPNAPGKVRSQVSVSAARFAISCRSFRVRQLSGPFK